MRILLLLPAKSLIRYKSVCKKWRSLISSDHFCHQHTLRHPKLQQSLIIQMNTMQSFYFNQATNGQKVMIPYSLGVPNHKILQDCNGLLLLESEHQTYYVYNPTTEKMNLNSKNSFYVYNPTTRQSRKNSLTKNFAFPYVAGIALAFDPSKSPYYKVVCVRSTSYKTTTYRIEVYDSESHTWKLSLKTTTCPRIFNDGLFWNNSIFWGTYREDDGGINGYYCFDIAKNEIKIVSLVPHAYEDEYYFCAYIEESNGHLYNTDLIRKTPNASVEVIVWELGGDDCSQWDWLPKHRGTIHVPLHSDQRIDMVRFMERPGRNGVTDCLLTFEAKSRRLMAYDFLNKSYELLVDFTGQPVPKLDEGMTGFQFGEIMALV